MAVKASATITLFDVVDVDGTTIYYLLQSSTANPPSKPTTDNPGGKWSTTEPTYTEGSTNTLYTVTKTKYSDGSFEYTPVSKSSSYEAAKSAYNKAVNANNNANTALNTVNNLQIGGRNLLYSKHTVNNKLTNETIDFTRGSLLFNTNVLFENRLYIPEKTGDVSKPYTSENTTGVEITISFEHKLNTNGVSRSILCYPFQNTGLSIKESSSFTPTNEWQRFSFKTHIYRWTTGNGSTVPGSNYTPESQGGSSYRTNGCVWVYDTIGTNYYSIRNIKVELGNKTTDWTPAPEDVNEAINQAQSLATEAYKIIISDKEPDSSKRDKIWYDTENNKFKEWNSTSSTWEIIHNYTSEINDAKALIEQAYDPTVKLANTLNQMMSALNNTVLGESIIVSETAPTSAADKLKIWLDVNNLSLNKWDYTMTYNLLTSKPSNWDTNYKDYYILVDGKYKSITDDTAPTWQANTYYSGTKSYSWMPVSPSSIMTTIDSHTVDIQKLKDKVVFDFETETDKVSFKDNWDTVFGKVKTLSQRFEFSALGLTITSSDSTTYKLRLTNEDIKILANDKEVTWWNATGFNCPVVTTESIVLRRKNFDENESRYSFRFVYNTNGSVSFRKVVES